MASVTWICDAYDDTTEEVRAPSVAKNSISFEFEDEGAWHLLVMKDNGQGQYVGAVNGYKYVGYRNGKTIKGFFTGVYSGKFEANLGD